MAIPPLPPLRVREQDGSPNVIPVFTIVVSNGTVVNQGGGTITIGMGTGAAGAAGAAGGGMAIGSGVTAGSSGAILFVDSNNQLAQDVSQLFWDNANNRLGVGGSSPTITFDVVGSGRVSSVFILGLQASSATHAVRADRLITTTFPLAGGGDLTADRTASVDTAFLVTSARTITAGSGLTGGGDFGADRVFSVNTNVRDKTAGFFAGGNLSTTHVAEQSRVYIPFNMELRDVRLAVATTPVGANIIINVGQFGTPVAAMSAFFTDALRPIIATGGSVGSAGTISNTVLFVGSWLGFSIDQVGTTVVGSDLTVTVIARSS